MFNRFVAVVFTGPWGKVIPMRTLNADEARLLRECCGSIANPSCRDQHARDEDYALVPRLLEYRYLHLERRPPCACCGYTSVYGSTTILGKEALRCYEALLLHVV